ncbi:MAG: hypothetical protein HKP00_03400, partial [Flavobacteriaceae bacterium]|nr:hypothetical protein [Flavobacteriaceae bacterium]
MMIRTLLLVAIFALSFNFNSTAQSALNFDGVDNGTGSYVDIGTFSLTSYTKEAWIKWDGTEFLQHNIISGSINGSQHAFWIVGDQLRSGHDGDWFGVTDPGLIIADTWYHCAVTYDGLTGEMNLYKDGVLVSTDPTPTPGFVLEGSYIGAFGNPSDQLVAVMSGDIDDARIWNYARTQSEIQADMNSCLSGNETGLEAFYHFEDGTGSTTLTDATGNGNDGILMNFDLATDWVTGQGVCEIIPPTVSFSTTVSSPTNSSPFTVTVTFSENIVGISPNDILVTNGTKSNFSGSGTTYSIDITPISDGAVTIDMGPGGVADLAGNGNLAAETPLVIDYDGTSPTVAITSTETSPTNTSPFAVTVTFSEDVTGFDVSDLS